MYLCTPVTAGDGSVPLLNPDNVYIYTSIIMRDEASNIKQCLDNTADLVDVYCLSDTGSLDETITIAQDWFHNHDRKGTITRELWRTYGINRTLSLRQTETQVRHDIQERTHLDLTKPLTWHQYQKLANYHTFSFITDVDNILKLEVGKGTVRLDKSKLVDDGYYIKSQRGDYTYRTVNLIRIDPLGVNRWTYYRSVHEYVDSATPIFKPKMNTISGCCNIYGTHGCRSQDPVRAIRDLTYLAMDDILEPNDARTTYYTAASLREAGYHADARKKFIQRAKMAGTYIDERYLSWLRAAELSDRRHSDQGYLKCLFAGYNLGCRRYEIGFRLCEYFRLKGQFNVAWALAKPLTQMEVARDSQFLDLNINNAEFYDSASVAAFYAGEKLESLRLAELAANYPHPSADFHQRTLNNIKLIRGLL